ncbi:unnamed protein product [Thelazia callipaeda]|uniref:WD_REPEATS_REGION domain-containing protein n=1 Tax=Thelazia callipaeda TaxID=103827 RepID=A0A0N5D5W4_THECL|nr:unnamed protein product [Thelazia callipaeda]
MLSEREFSSSEDSESEDSQSSSQYHRKNKKWSKSSSSARSNAKTPFKYLATVYEGHKKTIYGVAFSPYLTVNPHFATVGENRVSIYAIAKDGNGVRLLRSFHDSAKNESFFAICWGYDTENDVHVVIAGGNRGIIRVINVVTGELVNSLIGHGDAVNDVRVFPNDSMIVASASKDFTARIWNIHNSACLAILGGVEGHLDQVISVDFDASSEYLASASMDHTIKLWYVGKGSGVDRLVEQSKADLKVNYGFSPLLRNLIQLVDFPAEIHYPRCCTRDIHTNYVDCVRIFHRLIFSKSTENEIVLWKFGDFDDMLAGQGNKLKTETCVIHFRQLKLPETNMWYIKFEIDPLEKYLVCGNQKGEIHVWEINNGSLPSVKSNYVLRMKDVWCTVRQVAFSPCGQHMIAVADDASISRFIRQV